MAYESLNRIFIGAPGTGKTHAAVHKALEILAGGHFSLEEHSALYNRFVAEGRLLFTVFHPSWTYESFVESKDGTAGVFKRFCQTASASREPYVFLIDEIDRADAASIMGEMLTLIEESRRKGAVHEIQAVLAHSGELFSVPPNVYVLATMNTASKITASLDAGVRRRFSFTMFYPEASLLKGIEVYGVGMDKMLEAMNGRIEAMFDTEHRIGHAPFMRLKHSQNKEGELADIFRSGIIPQLFDYFDYNWEAVRKILNHQFIAEKTVKLPDNYKDIYYIDDSAYDKAESYRKLVDISL
jgi:5-methylcytosine-specific restriction endonuclease McrBC GTP-binding regulatory subunit McrB